MKKLLLLLLSTIIFSCQENNDKEQKKIINSKQETVKPSFDESVYKKRGKEIAMATFKVFKSHIQKVGQEKGLPGVVDFCNKNAKKLTDSMSTVNKVIITRTSHKLRNDKNAPNDSEKNIINDYLKSIEDGKKLIPVIKKDKEGFVHFYAPILLKQECLKCHGKIEKEVKAPILKLLREKYPNDKAVGFREGDLRGIWDIKFLED